MFQMLSVAVAALSGSFFAGKEGMTALSAAFPIQAILNALAVAAGIGSGAALSRAIGEGEKSKAERTASAAAVITAVTALSAVAAGVVSALFVLPLFNISEHDISEPRRHLIIVSAAFPAVAVHTVFNRTAVSEGVTVRPMMASIAGAAVTIGVDFMLFFMLKNFFSTAVKLAVADSSGQLVTMIISIFIAKKLPIKPFYSPSAPPDGNAFKEILKVSFPSAIQNGVDAMFGVFLNAVMPSGAAIAFYGAFYKVRQQALTPVYGLNQGTVPILGAAFGSGDRERFKKAFLISAAVALATALTVTVAAEIAAAELMNIFDLGDKTTYFRVLSAGFVPAAPALMLSAAFVATGSGGKAMTLNILRGAGIGLPAALIFRNFPEIYTWAALTAAEFVAVAIFLPTAFREYKKAPFGAEKQS